MTTPSPVEVLPDGLRALDTLTGGVTKVTAGYLIDAPRPTLVECGPALTIGSVIEGLAAVGLEPGDLAYLVVSHIHLDHAGGAGDVLAAFPHAEVVASEVGVRHLVDPERLNASSRRVYGPMFDSVYGACTPIDAERVVAVGDELTLDLGGGRHLELFYAPGHAKHHIAAFDPDTGALFVGDSVGVKLPEMARLRPGTPPPDFDYVLAQRTLDRYLELAPVTVYLAHYGAYGPPAEALHEAKERLTAWLATAEQGYAIEPDLAHVVETLAARYASEVDAGTADPEATRRLSILAGIESNAMGLLRYLQQRAAGNVAT